MPRTPPQSSQAAAPAEAPSRARSGQPDRSVPATRVAPRTPAPSSPAATPAAEQSRTRGGQPNRPAPAAGGVPPRTPAPSGQAVPRQARPPAGGAGGRPPAYVSPYRYGYGPYGSGAFNFNVFYGYRSPYWRAYPYGAYGYGTYGYGTYPYGAYPYGRYGYGAYPYSAYDYGYGSVRLRVTPREAAVHVDGYYVGIVDDFDGVFQHLDLEVGAHHIEIVAPGLEPLAFDVQVDPYRTITYRGDLLPLWP